MKVLIKEGRYLLVAALLLIALVAAVQAQIFSGAGFTIADGGGRVPASCSTVTVSGITTNVTVSSISINSINHTWIGDTQTMVYRPGAAPPPAFADTISSPPDDRACNFSGTYRYIDTGATTVDAATAGPCASAANVAPGDYRTSNYFGASGAGGPPTSLTAIFGTLTPAQANGAWLVCVFDYATPDGGTVGGTSIQLTAPTAATASLGGRVVTPDGRGISMTRVKLADKSGNGPTVLTNQFGYYRFDDLTVGQTYVLSVSSKSYQFENSSRIVTLNDSISDADFISLP